ncbi:hypothetical protein K504DRAFT_459832 [Pleomassaria siparia CBS 279.74]|uniref:Glycosylphosphatidylinositol anchor biosynthesis protein 11 n=1 Tax=Pleomassaria siparia CBS 279.74 TaxID=1314801 RepID=A0A6G1JYQ4_9PLEO|nr:hypothetical protein K504DRAFT_459832 [Pleomassaria siparia CBS 279.74]
MKIKDRALPEATNIYPTGFAQSYQHLHPFLVLALGSWYFNDIVANPIKGLSTALVWLAVLQIAYCVTCLPPYGTGKVVVEKKKPGEKEKKRSSQVATKIFTGLVALIMSLIVSLVVAATLVLFGAPMTTHHWETLLCAGHMSLLATLPLVYVRGVEGQTWQEAVALLLPVDDVYGGMIGTFVGAWLGAVPVPLDWDRAWQRWPVTIVTGAYVGYAIGKSIGATWGKGGKIVFV